MASLAGITTVSKHLRVLAVVVIAVLLSAAAVAITHPGSRPAAPVHYLGQQGLELAALTGGTTMYLDVPPIASSSNKSTHAGDIPITKMTWGVEATAASTGGAGGGQKVSDLTITKSLDKYSVPLLQAAVADKHLTSATIWLVRTDSKGNPIEQLSYQLTNPVVASDLHSVSRVLPSEVVSLQYSSLKISYYRGTTVGPFVEIRPAAAQ